MSSKITTYQQIFGIKSVPKHEFIERLNAYKFSETFKWKGTPDHLVEKDESYERLGKLAARAGINHLCGAGLAGPRAVENIYSMVVGAWDLKKKIDFSDYTVFELKQNINPLHNLYSRKMNNLPCQIEVEEGDILERLRTRYNKRAFNLVDFDFIGGLGGQTNAGKIDKICAALENCLFSEGPCVVHVNGSMRRGNSEEAYRKVYFPKLQKGLEKHFTLLESETKRYMGGQPMIGLQIALKRN